MAVTRISQSSLKQGLKKNKNFVAGIVPNFGQFESIQTITVGSSGATTLFFSDIPQNYQHLQLRCIARSTWSSAGLVILKIFFNGDSNQSNYSKHHLVGNGSSVTSYGGANDSGIDSLPGGFYTANVFGAVVVDILDYTNTSKTTTTRALGGFDSNGSGWSILGSNLWNNTAAVSNMSISLGPTSNFVQYSQVSLYGVKAL